MRFATTVEGLGVSLIDRVMTLIAFMPVSIRLSSTSTNCRSSAPFRIRLSSAAILWSLFGTVFLALVGIKLPGLEFRNQRVEAAYRKEFVYGEDHADRAQPPTVRNFSTMFAGTISGCISTISTSTSPASFICRSTTSFRCCPLAPSIVAGKITLGVIAPDSGRLRTGYVVVSSTWSIPGRRSIELLSIYKRLQAFEAAIDDEPLPEIDQHSSRRRRTKSWPEPNRVSMNDQKAERSAFFSSAIIGSASA